MLEYRLTPVELYFLGVLLEAEYIDYQYVSALPEIHNNYRVIEQKTLERLEEKNIIEQDFDGTITVDETVQNVLNPIFFGLIECRVRTTWSEGNLHVFNDNMTFVSKEHDFYLLEKMDDESLKELIIDQELELQAMHIEKGYYNESFSEEEMGQTDSIEKAISVMKGDW